MVRAYWNGEIIAESERCIVVEGNYNFPPEDVRFDYLRPSSSHSLCFWKGLASYYDIEVQGVRNANAAWYYPSPTFLARRIKHYVAFWNGVQVEPSGQMAHA